jgi:alkylation response protein AidB-like acyl-CoA dehydrogenase
VESEAAVLERAERFFLEHVRPNAQQIDRNPEALRSALEEMCRQNLMALRRPVAFGGPELSETAFRAFQEMSARYSGTLSFLMTQHQSAVSMIGKSGNESLKKAYLPEMGNGQKLVGIGFSQLRRSGSPLTTATLQQDGSVVVSGHVPWITGFGFFHEFIVGARLPDGRALFAIAPFTGQPGIAFSAPMQLAAMEAAQTVTAELASLIIPAERVVMIKPADWPETNDMINIVLQGHFALGCAQAGIDVIRQAFQRKKFDFLRATADRLQAEVDDCRSAALQIGGGMDDRTTQGKLEVRARAIRLAVRCAHAAVVASSGAANSMDHPAQRIYREALVFSVSAQTVDIMRATLESDRM